MDVMTAKSAAPRRFKMKTYTIDTENNISVFATAEEAAAASTTPFDNFTSRQELAELIAAWPSERIVATFNSLPGVAPVTRFKTSKVAANKIWERIEGLGGAPKPEAAKQDAATAKPKAATKAKGRARSAKGASAKAKSAKKATPPKPAPKAKKSAKPKDAASAPREGSKMAQAIALMQRKGGVTISELMETMGWQKHTCRGFVAGALKKAGYTVESFKPEGGERTYRINK
jgi:hypothetical protein